MHTGCAVETTRKAAIKARNVDLVVVVGINNAAMLWKQVLY
jgi:hypothetical protein